MDDALKAQLENFLKAAHTETVKALVHGDAAEQSILAISLGNMEITLRSRLGQMQGRLNAAAFGKPGAR